MEKKINKIGGLIVGFFLIFGIAYAIYRGYELKKNYKIVFGRVSEITIPGWKSSGDYSVLYEFKVHNEKYSNNDNLNLCGSLRIQQVRELIVNKFFPVAYDIKSPSTNVMILNQKIAKRFNYKIPDSLLVYISTLSCYKDE